MGQTARLDFAYQKYLKYKHKYIGLKNQIGGNPSNNNDSGDVEKNLRNFFVMNFEGFNKRNWSIINQFIDENIVTTFSNGMRLEGIDPTVHMLMKQVLDWAPDTKVVSHKIQFGSGDWIAVNMVISGTFTKPMIDLDGKKIMPTNKSYTLNNCILGHWKEGKLIELYVFGDSESMKKQLEIV